VVWAAEASYASFGELAELIGRLAAETPARCARVRVVLERPPVQMRTLQDLPPVKDQELPALVAHQPGRFFRRNGAPLVTDAVWVGHRAARLARAVAIEEPLLEAIVAGAKAAGLALDAITPVECPDSVLLLPNAERAVRKRAQRTRVGRLSVAVAAAWLAAGLLVGGRLTLERRALARESTALAQPLSAVLAARRELREASATLLVIHEAERSRGRALAALAAVTSALPDSTVLTSFTWNAEGPGVLTGAARRAADIVARLERSADLPEPRLEGPVVREAVSGHDWERFTVVFGRHP
jgi:hypothetical protein